MNFSRIATLGMKLCLMLIIPGSVFAEISQKPRSEQLMIELQDGSRLLGASEEKCFNLRSTLLGEFKLPVNDIRTMECVSTNGLRLNTINNDTLIVTFADNKVSMETIFGKVTLTVNSIRTLTVMGNNIRDWQLGLVALWPGEGDGKDTVGHHDMELTDITFAKGKVGQAFLFNGYSSWASVPTSPDLESELASAGGFTISTWINPNNVDSFHPILEWEVTKQKSAVSLWLGHLPHDHGVLSGNIGDTDGNNHQIISAPGTIVVNQFQFVALTYDKKTGVSRLFANGRIVAQDNIGLVIPNTSGTIYLSRRPSDEPGDWTYNCFFSGLVDEVAIYNRALSPAEIQAAYHGNDDIDSADNQ